MTKTLIPKRGFVKIYPLFFFLNKKIERALIIDFEIKKYRIEADDYKWNIKKIKGNTSDIDLKLMMRYVAISIKYYLMFIVNMLRV